MSLLIYVTAITYLHVSAKSIDNEVEDIGEVLTADHMPDMIKEIYGEIVATPQCESYHCCLICETKVDESFSIVRQCCNHGTNSR